MFEFIDNRHEHSFNVAHDIICALACSQGMYSRLYSDLIESDWQPLYELTIEYYFDEPLDFVFFFEC